jgi:ribosomal-protein-alanine N-acetyltransferase
MLEGKRVNLRIMEKENLSIVKEWDNEVGIMGEYEPIIQETKAELEQQYEKLTEGQWFFIEKKDGTKIGFIAHFQSSNKQAGIGYALLPDERSKGYGSEAVQLIVDYLYLTKNIIRIQAETHPQNLASQRILEKAGFEKEGIIRKSFFSRGELRDTAMFSILRDEWKKPKIIGKSS